MSTLIEAITRAFVAPASDASRAAADCAPAAVVPSAAVCGPEAEPVGCALALALRRRGPVVVCLWGAAARRPSVPATSGARRIAASLAARAIDARASGRLVAVALDATPAVAIAQAARAAAAAGDAPVVTALCGARDDAFDGLLMAQDLAVVALGDACPELARLSVSSLGAVSRRVVRAGRVAGAAGWAARAGVGAGPGTRSALAAALDAVR
jgi:hypothetical protein